MVFNDWVLLGMAFLGTFMHWVKEKFTGDVVGSPIDYIKKYPWHSVGMFGTTLSVCATAIATGQLHYAGAFGAAMAGFGLGWVSDSVINRGPKNADLTK
jgi:hypothetical protein